MTGVVIGDVPVSRRPGRRRLLLPAVALVTVGVWLLTPEPPRPPGEWTAAVLDTDSVQVTSIDRGAAGWIAVTQGGAIVAHVSSDAASWASFVLAGLSGFNPVAVSGESLIAVASSGFPGTGAPTAAAISDDGGTTWRLSTVETEGGVVLAAAASGDVLVLGGALDEGGTFQLVDGGTAAMWFLEGESWRRAVAEPGSLIRTVVVDAGGTVWAFGHAGETPAAWTLVDSGLKRMGLELPETRSAAGFVDVTYDGSRYVAVIGARGVATSGRHVVWSDDLLRWDTLAEADADLVSLASPGDGVVLGRMLEGGRLWSFAGSVASATAEYPGDTGVVRLPVMGAVEAEQGVTVAGGTLDGSAVLLTGT